MKINEKLTYKDLDFPTFVGSREAMRLKTFNENGEEKQIVVPFHDIPKAAVLGGISFLNIGDTRCGKSQLMRDIHRHYFGGGSDQGGKSNWNVARNDFSSEAFFMTIDQSKVGEGKGMLCESRVPIEKRIRALCNIVDELNLAIPEIQVEFFGIAEGEHKGTRLGEKGYHLFIASCNINRVNGDFAGTSQINRALLNRFGITLDFDFFKRTDDDDDVLSQRSGREQAPIRDISSKIMDAYKEITKSSCEREPWLEAYLRMFSSGLDYCHKDSDNLKKKAWPSNCGTCSEAGKDLCSLVKQSNTGTIQLLKRFANSVNYLIQLKHDKVNVDPFNLALESFKFTTYHGNLNAVETFSKYGGEDQEQMRDTVRRIREKIMPVKPYIDLAVDSAVKGVSETRFIELDGEQSKEIEIYSEKLNKKLESLKSKRGLNYRVVDPFDRDFARTKGIRIDWFKGYLNSIANFYIQNQKCQTS